MEKHLNFPVYPTHFARDRHFYLETVFIYCVNNQLIRKYSPFDSCSEDWKHFSLDQKLISVKEIFHNLFLKSAV